MTRNILREDHILRPMRLRYVYELLDAYNIFTKDNVLIQSPRLAHRDEIASFHQTDYVDAVKDFSSGKNLERQHLYNFSDSGDNPTTTGMYESAALSVGASLVAAETIWNQNTDVAFNAGGGFHHAMPGYAHGFCIFNDIVIAIQEMVAQGARVAYIDIDAHHGDGVQHAFYDTDQVLTISIHESGDYLFPGTGQVEEYGKQSGRGYAINVPLAPGTSDKTYLWAFKTIVPPLVMKFEPDILATQIGIDSHFADPLTHLKITTFGYKKIIEELKSLSPGRWIAFGGGGYDMSAVARSWALAFATMSGVELGPTLPSVFTERYGLQHLYDVETTTIDPESDANPMHIAKKSIQTIQREIFPLHKI